MRMNLKNRKKLKLKFKFMTKKNYFFFLICFFLISIIIGIFFFLYMNSIDKQQVYESLNNYFTLKDSYNYKTILFSNIKNNLKFGIIMWILGISVIGIILNVFLYFGEGFSLGFTISSMFSYYKNKAIVGMFCYLFPTRIIFLLILFILTYNSLKFSYHLIEHLFLKKELDLREKLKSYYKVLIFSLILLFLISILETFLMPFFIKIFTKLQ